MQDAAEMRVLDRVGKRRHETRRAVASHVAAMIAEPVAQRGARTVMKGNVQPASPRAGFIDLVDIRMIQACRSAGFAQESLHELRCVPHGWVQDFEGHLAIEAVVPGEVNHAETAAVPVRG